MGKELRDNKLDIIKGIGIILMVVGHSGSPLKTWIYLFHMPLFFVVSGFCIKDRYSETIADMWNFVKKKIRALYIPCLFFTLLILFCHNFLVRFFIIDGEIYKTKQFIIGIAKCLCFSGGGQLSGAMWFFRTMFLSSVLYVLVEFFCKRVSHRYYDIVKSTVFFLILVIVWLIPNTTEAYKYLNCLTMLIILQLGHLMFKYQNILLGGGKTYILGLCSLLVLIMLTLFNVTVDINLNIFPSPLLLILASFCGYCFCNLLAEIVLRSKLGNAVSYIGRNTISIVMWHYACMKLITLCEIIFYDLPIQKLRVSPYLISSDGWWILYSIAGILLPLGINAAYQSVKKVLISRTQTENCTRF